MFCFHVYGLVSPKYIKTKKKSLHHIFIQQRKISKNIYVLACVLAVITSLLKPRELGQYFKNSKKIIWFSFNIWGYDLIRKTHFGY